jgi:hypothetical protein
VAFALAGVLAPAAVPAPAAARAVVRCAGVRATIVGGSRGDILRGTPRRDVIVGLGGGDRIIAGGGNDLICAGPGRDVVAGGPGADVVLGGLGADRLFGGNGNDRLLGGPARDVLDGGRGTDTCLNGRGGASRRRCELPPPPPLPVPPLPVPDRQPGTPLRLATFDAAYPEDWARGAHFAPSLGRYQSGAPAVVAKHLAALRYGRFSAAVVDWAGPGSPSDVHLAAILGSAAARSSSFRWAVGVRSEAAGDPPAARILQDVTYLRARHGHRLAYLRRAGRFLVFVSTEAGESCDAPARWGAARGLGALIVMETFPGAAACPQQPDGWYATNSASSETAVPGASFAISPGSWPADDGAPTLSRDLSRFSTAIRDMVASKAPLQLVTSFNHFADGTAVESSPSWETRSGFGAYLDALHGNGLPPASTGDPVVVAAGDIACAPGTPANAEACHQRQTSELLSATDAAILTLGDTQYERNAIGDFMRSFDPTWGRFKSLIHPAIGNHEYLTPGASGYFDYFGPAAGDRSRAYYSFDVGRWHLIVLNGNCGKVSCAAGSAQETWLRSDLADHSAPCTLAYWHQPRFSSGQFSNEPQYDAFWRALSAAGAELVLNGHDHDYERFAPQTPDGVADGQRGIREFVVGTGGKSVDQKSTGRKRNSEVYDTSSFGVLQLTLHPAGYDWHFLHEAGGTLDDAGSDACH